MYEVARHHSFLTPRVNTYLKKLILLSSSSISPFLIFVSSPSPPSSSSLLFLSHFLTPPCLFSLFSLSLSLFVPLLTSFPHFPSSSFASPSHSSPPPPITGSSSGRYRATAINAMIARISWTCLSFFRVPPHFFSPHFATTASRDLRAATRSAPATTRPVGVARRNILSGATRAQCRARRWPGPERIEGRASRADDGPAFAKGDRVFHMKFGEGAVVSVDGAKLSVDFDRAGRKLVMDSFVTRAG